jgi:hypothetical protein
MLFLPSVATIDNHDDKAMHQLEYNLFGGYDRSNQQQPRIGRKRIKYRLLREFVNDHVRVSRDDLLNVSR